MKTFLKEAIGLLSGGFGDKVFEAVKTYFPPSMSAADKLRIRSAINSQLHRETVTLIELGHQAQAEHNEQIRKMEGTASDLMQYGWFGRFIIFLRGLQRPLWGYATLYMDFCWFSGKYASLTDTQDAALWTINGLVLVFLFGERAAQNVLPLFKTLLEIKAGIASTASRAESTRG